MPIRSRFSLWEEAHRALDRKLLREAFARKASYGSAARYLGIDKAYVLRRSRELGIVPGK